MEKEESHEQAIRKAAKSEKEKFTAKFRCDDEGRRAKNSSNDLEFSPLAVCVKIVMKEKEGRSAASEAFSLYNCVCV